LAIEWAEKVEEKKWLLIEKSFNSLVLEEPSQPRELKYGQLGKTRKHAKASKKYV
jgi:hypothetical protein